MFSPDLAFDTSFTPAHLCGCVGELQGLSIYGWHSLPDCWEARVHTCCLRTSFWSSLPTLLFLLVMPAAPAVACWGITDMFYAGGAWLQQS
jgi:hypothetical protein